MLKIRVIYWNQYDFKDSKSGETVKGCKIQYLLIDQVTKKPNQGGTEAISASVEYEVGDMLRGLSDHNDWNFEASVGARVFNGKAEMTIVGLKHMPRVKA